MPKAPNVTLSLYRLTITLPRQRTLYDPPLDREALLKSLLKEPPSLQSHNVTWHVGNIKKLDDSGFYFAIGKTSATQLEHWDEPSRSFRNVDYETSPHTHVVLDTRLQILAIAAKTRVAPTVKSIANRVEQILGLGLSNVNSDARLTIDSIPDTVSFISHIKAAYAILSFTVKIGLPNHFDADDQFQKPLERYAQASNAEETKVTVKGIDLSSETLVAVTKSVAATGQSAQAKLRPTEDSASRTINLNENQATVAVPEEDFDPAAALETARLEYHRIRDDAENPMKGGDDASGPE